MKRHEWWRLQYNEDPYLGFLERELLKQRTEHVIANGLIVSDNLKYSLLPVDGAGEYWMISWTHLLEEWGKRGGLPPNPDRSLLPKVDWPGLASAIPPFAESRHQHASVIVKYGKRQHMNDLFELGRVRVGAAASYDDPSLKAAVRDDELNLSIYRRSRLYTLLYDQHGYQLAPTGPKHGVRVETVKSATNYYVYCLGLERSLRMFGDFEADAAVIIHEPARFVRRLGETVRTALGPGWSWYATPIRYVDPLRAPTNTLNVVECKDFRFAYQREYRVIWLPNTPCQALAPVFVEIGSIADIARLVELQVA